MISMKRIREEGIFDNAPFGYVLHKAVFNSKGEKIDYEFIEVNTSFTRIFDLKKETIIGSNLKGFLNNYVHVKNDWLDFYKKVDQKSQIMFYEHLTDNKLKYYRVDSYSPKENYYITLFSDISDEFLENEKLKRMINSANVGTWEWNILTGETTFNQQWAEMIGYSIEEISPVSIETWRHFTHPDDLKKSDALLKSHFNKENDLYKCEVRLLHKNGNWIWVLDSGKVTNWTIDGNPLLMSGIHQNITERKKAELKLYDMLEVEKIISEISTEFNQSDDIDATINSSFAKLGKLSNSSRIYLFMIDNKSQTMSNTHEWCNEGVNAEIDNLQNLPLSIFPWWIEKLNKKEILEISNVSELPLEAKQEKETLESQDIKSVIVVPIFNINQLIGFVGFDNVLSIGVWSEKDNLFLNILGDTLSNAIVKNKNEEELRLLAKALEEMPVSVAITDFEGNLTYVNSGFEKITGYSKEEVLGKNPRIINSGMQPSSFFTEMWNTILSGKTWRGELQNKNKKGEIYWTFLIIAPIIYNGKIRHFVSAAQDTIEKNNFIKELIDAKFKAEESDRLKSIFLSTMNHELKTPLNQVIGFSSLIPDMTEDESIKEFSKLIYDSGANLLKLIEDIFDLSMLESKDIKIRYDNILIRDLFIELKNLLKEQLYVFNKEDSIELKFKFDSSVISKRIITDKSKVKQLMLNIFKNAIKYTHKGDITLSLNLENDNRMSIKVKDTGIGISKEKQGIIFDFFRQVDDSYSRSYEGVGIGLAISQRIADAMKGKISVESEPEIGSEFTFSFPITLSSEDIIEYEN